jgi:hypothetical protein
MMPVQNAAKLLVQSSNALRAFKVREPRGGERFKVQSSKQLEKTLL